MFKLNIAKDGTGIAMQTVDTLMQPLSSCLPGLRRLAVCSPLHLRSAASVLALTALRSLQTLHIKRFANFSWAYDA